MNSKCFEVLQIKLEAVQSYNRQVGKHVSHTFEAGAKVMLASRTLIKQGISPELLRRKANGPQCLDDAKWAYDKSTNSPFGIE